MYRGAACRARDPHPGREGFPECVRGVRSEGAAFAVGRAQIALEITERANARRLDELGIELLDFRFKRTDYVDEVQDDVFARMISERYRAAEEFRSMGAGEQARIRGMRERELARIRSEAIRGAEELRGAADAEAARVVDGSSTLVLGTNSRLFRLLEGGR